MEQGGKKKYGRKQPLPPIPTDASSKPVVAASDSSSNPSSEFSVSPESLSINTNVSTSASEKRNQPQSPSPLRHAITSSSTSTSASMETDTHLAVDHSPEPFLTPTSEYGRGFSDEPQSHQRRPAHVETSEEDALTPRPIASVSPLFVIETVDGDSDGIVKSVSAPQSTSAKAMKTNLGAQPSGSGEEVTQDQWAWWLDVDLNLESHQHLLYFVEWATLLPLPFPWTTTVVTENDLKIYVNRVTGEERLDHPLAERIRAMMLSRRRFGVSSSSIMTLDQRANSEYKLDRSGSVTRVNLASSFALNKLGLGARSTNSVAGDHEQLVTLQSKMSQVNVSIPVIQQARDTTSVGVQTEKIQEMSKRDTLVQTEAPILLNSSAQTDPIQDVSPPKMASKDPDQLPVQQTIVQQLAPDWEKSLLPEIARILDAHKNSIAGALEPLKHVLKDLHDINMQVTSIPETIHSQQSQMSNKQLNELRQAIEHDSQKLHGTLAEFQTAWTLLTQPTLADLRNELLQLRSEFATQAENLERRRTDLDRLAQDREQKFRMDKREMDRQVEDCQIELQQLHKQRQVVQETMQNERSSWSSERAQGAEELRALTEQKLRVGHEITMAQAELDKIQMKVSMTQLSLSQLESTKKDLGAQEQQLRQVHHESIQYKLQGQKLMDEALMVKREAMNLKQRLTEDRLKLEQERRHFEELRLTSVRNGPSSSQYMYGKKSGALSKMTETRVSQMRDTYLSMRDHILNTPGSSTVEGHGVDTQTLLIQQQRAVLDKA